MKTWTYTCDLIDDPEIIKKYDQAHVAIWPEVAKSLVKVGMKEIRIWRLGNRLVMQVTTEETFDPEIAGDTHRANHPRCGEWEDLMTSYQKRMTGIDGEGTWAEMQQVFELKDIDGKND